MSTKKLTGKALVIQITREEIRIGLMRLGQVNPELQASLLLPTPEGAVEDGEIRNLTALKDALRPALEDPTFRRVRRTVFVLCSSRVISSSARLPAKQKGARLGQVLQANMDEYFPVQTEDYLLTWEHVGYAMDGSLKESVIQLWAVPRMLVSRYYELAAGLGLTVACIDYCGNAAAAAAGASFAGSGKKAAKLEKKAKKGGLTLGRRKKDVELEEEEDGGVAVMEPALAPSDAALYLHIDDDSIISTFVSGGRVKLQRLVQRGFSLEADLSETAISLEYFNSLPGSDDVVTRAILSGSAVEEAEQGGVGEILGVPTEHLSCMPDPSWALVLGASRTKLEFGIPDLSRDGSEMKLWQFGLVFAGGAALVGVAMLFMTSSLTWSTELGNLRNTQNQMMILAQQNAGAAQAYHDYESAYNAYSSDWTVIYGTDATPGAIRTYNDNLVRILEELEEHVPTSATVTTFNMTDQSVAAQVAFKKLEDVAYFIQKLRGMNYAKLDGISSISIGPYYTAQMLRAMQQQSADASGDLLANLFAGGGLGDLSGLEGLTGGMDMASLMAMAGLLESAPTEGGTEAPPTEGGISDTLGKLFETASGGDLDMDDLSLDTVLPILVEANGGGNLDMDDLVRYATLMEAVERGAYDEIDAGDLVDILNAMDEDNDYTESDVKKILNLVGSLTGNKKDEEEDKKEYTEEDVKDMIESSGGKLSDLTSSEIQDLLDALNGTSNKTSAVSQLLEAQNIDVKQLRLNLQYLDKNQLSILQTNYGSTSDATKYDEEDLEDLLDDKSTTQKDRKEAIESLLHNDSKKMKDDPAAMYRFFLLLQEDKERSKNKQVLYHLIEAEIMKEPDMHRMIYQSNQTMLNRHLDDLIDLLVKSKKNLEATEELIMSDDKLAAKYAAHLAEVTGEIKTVDTSVNMEKVLSALKTGKVMSKSAKVQDAVLALLPESTRALYLAAVGNSANNGMLGNLGNLGSLGGQQITPEIRYFITVSLAYDESLIQAELARKGLDHTSKIGKLEVTQ